MGNASDRRYVMVGAAATLLGMSPTNVYALVKAGHLHPHGERPMKFDIVELVKLRKSRTEQRAHVSGRRTSLESLLGLATPAPSITGLATRQKRLKRM
jgi:hypothetical protein